MDGSRAVQRRQVIYKGKKDAAVWKWWIVTGPVPRRWATNERGRIVCGRWIVVVVEQRLEVCDQISTGKRENRDDPGKLDGFQRRLTRPLQG